MMVHLDLFSGIGGFAYAADQVFGDVEHIFCDNEPFAQAVLHKHWPEAKIYNDIKEITADTFGDEWEPGRSQRVEEGQTSEYRRYPSIGLLTGGFPCQPFSAAGLRRGTADDRHLWPEMLRVIRLTEPTWVIAENVRGLLTWNGGLVFEQVCADLEAGGYEVQPFIIPAVAVNAPHRRDRVWFVAHAIGGADRGGASQDGSQTQEERLQKRHEMGQPSQPSEVQPPATDTIDGRPRRTKRKGDTASEGLSQEHRPQHSATRQLERTDSDGRLGAFDWTDDWSEVAAELCSVDDGLPAKMGRLELSKPQHRKEQLKAYGNAIVPQVAMEIMKGMLI